MTLCAVTGCNNQVSGHSWNYCVKHSEQPMKVQVDTIDMTPTWTRLLPLFDQVINDGTPNAKTILKAELRTMAKAADLYNTSVTTADEGEHKIQRHIHDAVMAERRACAQLAYEYSDVAYTKITNRGDYA